MDKGMKITKTEKAVMDVVVSRWKLGREKYGVGIDPSQRETLQGWLDEAIEEAADMLQYLVAMKVKMEKNGK